MRLLIPVVTHQADTIDVNAGLAPQSFGHFAARTTKRSISRASDTTGTNFCAERGILKDGFFT